MEDIKDYIDGTYGLTNSWCSTPEINERILEKLGHIDNKDSSDTNPNGDLCFQIERDLQTIERYKTKIECLADEILNEIIQKIEKAIANEQEEKLNTLTKAIAADNNKDKADGNAQSNCYKVLDELAKNTDIGLNSIKETSYNALKQLESFKKKLLILLNDIKTMNNIDEDGKIENYKRILPEMRRAIKKIYKKTIKELDECKCHAIDTII